MEPVHVAAAAFFVNAIGTAIGVFVYMQKREDRMMKAIEDRVAPVEKESDEIKSNYLKRFEALTQKLHEMQVEVVRELGEIKSMIQHK